jgi:hypothetical protein
MEADTTPIDKYWVVSFPGMHSLLENRYIRRLCIEIHFFFFTFHISYLLVHLLHLYLPHFLPLHCGILLFPLIPQRGKNDIRHQDRQTQTPHQSDGVEEIRVSGARIDPEMVECGPKQGCVEKSGCREECVARD